MKSSPPGPEDASDSTLHVLDRARSGDRAAVQLLIEQALPSVRRWARGRLPRYARGTADTEDLVQDAVVGLLGRLAQFQHRTVGGLQAYLRQAVVNRIRDLLRRAHRRGTDAPPTVDPRDWQPSPLEAMILGQQLDRFLAALRRLRPADRQLIVWRIELGYTPDEIAARLGKSRAAAAMSVSRAMARLATALELEAGISEK